MKYLKYIIHLVAILSIAAVILLYGTAIILGFIREWSEIREWIDWTGAIVFIGFCSICASALLIENKTHGPK